ncbi:hypothetical protein PAHAL_4G112000 [Panicum hallii]|uniref:Uncharacterized protein n=1 Tax=Panicum hallii TaxID=206008 RepID=A0A2T8JCN0_9POAL|nr:hypothetical protein PAHAL_4G112000 [Panicum hallii]
MFFFFGWPPLCLIPGSTTASICLNRFCINNGCLPSSFIQWWNLDSYTLDNLYSDGYSFDAPFMLLPMPY